MGPQAGLQLVEKLPDIAAYIVRQPKGKQEVFESSRWRRFEDTSPKR